MGGNGQIIWHICIKRAMARLLSACFYHRPVHHCRILRHDSYGTGRRRNYQWESQITDLFPASFSALSVWILNRASGSACRWLPPAYFWLWMCGSVTVPAPVFILFLWCFLRSCFCYGRLLLYILSPYWQNSIKKRPEFYCGHFCFPSATCCGHCWCFLPWRPPSGSSALSRALYLSLSVWYLNFRPPGLRVSLNLTCRSSSGPVSNRLRHCPLQKKPAAHPARRNLNEIYHNETSWMKRNKNEITWTNLNKNPLSARIRI